MKNLILGIALVGCAFACKTEKNASISDESNANMPKAECCKEAKGECSDKAKAECKTNTECQKACPATKPQG